MSNVKFEFTVDETNLILEVLGQLPFKQVYQLIAKIQQQAQAQASHGEAEGGERASAAE